MNPKTDILKQCAVQIIEEHPFLVGEDSPIITIHQLYTELQGLDLTTQTLLHGEDSDLPLGKALSPQGAAKCLTEQLRTIKFIQGIYASVKDVQRRFPGERINIVYAGCGPYASLILPLCTVFEPNEIDITLLEYHSYSLESAKALIGKLELEAYFSSYCQTDATTYTYPKEKRLHLVVSETLQACLAKEPQVAITHQLSKQLVEGGLMIPENITIDLVRGNFKTNDPLTPGRGEDFVHLESVFDLRSAVAGCIEITLPNSFASKKVVLPHKLGADDCLFLLTTINLFKTIQLLPYESGLTEPCLIHDFRYSNDLKSIDFQYHLGNIPELKMKFNYEADFVPL